MDTFTIKKTKYILIYYFVLLLVTFLIMRPNEDLSISTRLGLMALYFIPSFYDLKLFPFVFVTFCGISRNSFSPILPTSLIYIVIPVIIAYVLYHKKSSVFGQSLLIYLYFAVIAVFYYDVDQEYLVWIPMAIVVSDMITTKKDLQMIFFAFISITVFLAFLYILHQSVFSRVYRSESLGLETVGWENSNGFGGVIAAGGVLAVGYLTNILKFSRNIKTTILCGITLAASFYVLTLNASRGSFFAFSIASAFMLLFSKSKTYLKVILLALMALFVVWMMNNNVFELLNYRMQEDTFDTGGDRTRILQIKLSAFFMDTNPLHLLFGIGRKNCIELAELISTHNDFLTALIGFGLVGFVIYVYITIIYPIRLALRYKNFVPVSCLLLYFIFEGCVLEPVFRGYIVIIMFCFFILKYAVLMKDQGNVQGIQNKLQR